MRIHAAVTDTVPGQIQIFAACGCTTGEFESAVKFQPCFTHRSDEALKTAFLMRQEEEQWQYNDFRFA